VTVNRHGKTRASIEQATVGSGFTSDWLKKWHARVALANHTGRSPWAPGTGQSATRQTQFTFDTQLKPAL